MDLTYYSLILLTLIGFLLVRRGAHQTEVCKIMGIKIASEEVLELNKNGYQNSLTDPSGNKWFFSWLDSFLSWLVIYVEKLRLLVSLRFTEHIFCDYKYLWCSHSLKT